MAKKILVVDGSVLLRRLIKQGLSNYGYYVIAEAKDAGEAIEQFKANEADLDLVLLDVLGAELEGLQALTAIREINREIPVIMMGMAIPTNQAAQAGANDCLRKPFETSELLKKVAKAIGEP